MRVESPACETCGHTPHDFDRLPEPRYSYLLGMYLGDGMISRGRRRCYRLRIFMDSRYPGIIGEVAAAMREVMPTSVATIQPKPPHNLVEVNSYSNAWSCLFPQHGPGRKHERKIELAPWQEAIVDREPEQFIRGLIHSDGCRTTNRVTVGAGATPIRGTSLPGLEGHPGGLLSELPPAGHRIHLQRRPRARDLGRSRGQRCPPRFLRRAQDLEPPARGNKRLGLEKGVARV